MAPACSLSSTDMLKSEMIRKLLRFGVVGGGVTATFMGLNWWFGRSLGATTAYLLAYPPAVALHFFLNKFWTFGDRGGVKPRQLSEYLVLLVVAFLLQTAAFLLLTRVATMVPWLASGLATVLQMGFSFIFMQRRIFVSRVQRPAD